MESFPWDSIGFREPEDSCCEEVIIASEDAQLVGAVTRPKAWAAWPSFKFHSSELIQILGNFLEWKVEQEPYYANKGAFSITRSVVKGDRSQSYVATGRPVWLDYIFESESFTLCCCWVIVFGYGFVDV